MATWRIRPVGEYAVLIEFGSAIDEQINRQVHHIAHWIRAQMPLVRDVIPAYTTVLVLYSPEMGGLDWNGLVAEALATMPAQDTRGRHVTLPVAYGEEFGPDLNDVAQMHQMQRDAVIAAHAGKDYRVYCLGFSPGFPFLGPVPESIRAPRRPTPRSTVPAGSVGIAEQQTGIYATATPGGWQIIGRTPIRLFRPELDAPIPYEPGDVVRFWPIDAKMYQVLANDPAIQNGPWPDQLWAGGW
ncbi:MAG: 5-oxoprolinase subunit PxpB [Sulfobacillus thermotolerans]|uniref:Carboxyltransferase domain-containing protein n=1 Tax=Sulfobacillus thermotolerans TaxID=338644 RepID=A0ABM6RP77_9FIRM|nr:hypothetical protein BXT84_03315 [Sulfobacillus thermotolerans]MCY0908281.1 5-oxoprolinase subunit PxpB [Sulfobacillus thermotolerans]